MAALPETISPTLLAIDRALEAKNKPRFGRRISASSIGKPCERQLWYSFRWAQLPEVFPGRMLRLFETGNVEEGRMIDWLRLAGLTVEDRDPETGRQWEVEGASGHLGGYTDGRVTGVVEAPVKPHLLECKTHNAKSFAQLLKHGVEISKPEHYAQMQIYMHLLGLDRALYVAENKDNSELHIERVRCDVAYAARLVEKAERIRTADKAPSRISDDPGSYQCRFCPSTATCHTGQLALRNCRTCLSSTAIDGGGWRCDRFDKALTMDDQKAGCPSHLYLPTLVHGEQIDALGDDKIESVVYRMRDGSEWRDGGGL